MGSRLLITLSILSCFLFSFSLESRERSASTRVTRSVVNFVWKNPSSCKIDSLLQGLLLEEEKSFSSLSKFWKQSSLCNPNQKTKDAYLVKQALIEELKRVINAVSKSRPTELVNAIHNKRFQRLMLANLQALYSKYLRREVKAFKLQMSEQSVILALDQHSYSTFKEGDIRRLVEFSVRRSLSGRSYDGLQMASGAYGSVTRIGNGAGLVNRVTWYTIGEPQYEPSLMSDSIHGTYEVGLTTLGSDKYAAEIVGIFEVSNYGRPKKLLALNLAWTPESVSDFEDSLTTWVDQETNEKFVGLSGGYKFESHPFEPFLRFFRSFKKGKNPPKP